MFQSLRAPPPRRHIGIPPAPRSPAPILGIARPNVYRRAAIGRSIGRIERPLRRGLLLRGKKAAEQTPKEAAAIGGPRIIVVARIVSAGSARVVAVGRALVRAVGIARIIALGDRLL